MGENGQLQATLDVHNVVYTGSGYAGSMLAMDKEIAKILLEKVGIKVPFGVRIGKNDIPNIEEIYIIFIRYMKLINIINSHVSWYQESQLGINYSKQSHGKV